MGAGKTILRLLVLFSLPIMIANGGHRTYAQQSHEKVSETLTLYTVNYPPLNYAKDGEFHGLSIDILQELFTRANMRLEAQTLVNLPWARAYVQTLKQENTMLFPVIHTPLRDQSFKWVGPIGKASSVLMARKAKNIQLQEKSDFFLYRYAVVQHDRTEQALSRLGIPPSHRVYTPSAAIAANLLARERVHMWAYERLVALWFLEQAGHNPAEFEAVFSFDQYEYAFAFNKETPDALLHALQGALDSMHQDGTLKALIHTHLPQEANCFFMPYTPKKSPPK